MESRKKPCVRQKYLCKNAENSTGFHQIKRAGSRKATCPDSQSQRCYQSSVRLKARARSSTEELTMTLSPDFMVS